jgi:prepilin-type N-terminal cleavage/methylation domain-containing protein
MQVKRNYSRKSLALQTFQKSYKVGSMGQERFKTTSRRNGFTLIEMMLVVAIIGILAGIAIPQFSAMNLRSKEATTKGNLGSIRSALAVYYGDSDENFPRDNLATLIADQKYLSALPPALLPATAQSSGHWAAVGVTAGPFPGAVDDAASGAGWAYDNSGDPTLQWGTVVVNCSHRDMIGNAWTSY